MGDRVDEIQNQVEGLASWGLGLAELGKIKIKETLATNLVASRRLNSDSCNGNTCANI